MAVVENDLRESFGHADETNAASLKGIVEWFYNYAPVGCWGYKGAFKSWCAILAKETDDGSD